MFAVDPDKVRACVGRLDNIGVWRAQQTNLPPPSPLAKRHTSLVSHLLCTEQLDAPAGQKHRSISAEVDGHLVPRGDSAATGAPLGTSADDGSAVYPYTGGWRRRTRYRHSSSRHRPVLMGRASHRQTAGGLPQTVHMEAAPFAYRTQRQRLPLRLKYTARK